MSTRCHIAVYPFEDSNDNDFTALLYRHCDGYPESQHGVLAVLVPFVKKFVAGRGYDDEYLAARLLQEMTNKTDVDGDNFLGYGICREFHGDTDFIYRVYPDRIVVEGYDDKQVINYRED